MRGEAVRNEEQSLPSHPLPPLPPGPQQYLHLHNRHEPRHRLCRGNTSPSSAASLLRLGCNVRSNDGPAKTMGNGRQRETSTGPLVPCPSSLVGPYVGIKRCLPGSLDGKTRLRRLLHKPLAWARCRRAQQRPLSLADTAHADTSQGSPDQSDLCD